MTATKTCWIAKLFEGTDVAAFVAVAVGAFVDVLVELAI